MERTVLLVAVAGFGCLLLVLAWKQKSEPRTDANRVRMAKFMSAHWSLQAFQAVVLAIVCAVLAVVAAVNGDLENAAIPAGIAVVSIIFAAVQRVLAREEKKKLD